MKNLIVFLILGTAIDALQNDLKKPIQPRGDITYVNMAYYPSAVYVINRQDALKDCGGVIINSEWIMTSEHCASEAVQNVTNIKISAGATFIGYGGTWHYAVEGHTTKETGFLDHGGVGVIKVTPHFNFSGDQIKPAILASQDVIPLPEDNVTILGRKLINSENGIGVAGLRKKTTKVVDISECNNVYKKNYAFDYRYFCTKAPERNDEPFCLWGLTDPTFQNDAMVGLRILDFNCSYLPNVYIRVSTFRDWILDKTKGPISFCSSVHF